MSLEKNNLTEKNPPAPMDISGASFLEEEQIGGGRRAPSPPPMLTPTRLRTAVKATTRDVGLVRSAQARRGRLLQPEAPPSSAKEDDPFSAPPETSISSTENAVLCASLLFEGDATGEGVSFYGTGSLITDDATTAMEIAGRHDNDSAAFKGHSSPGPSDAVGRNALSVSNEKIPPPALISTPPGPLEEAGRNGLSVSNESPASLPPPDFSEPAVASPFFDEDTPRPAPGVLPTVSSITGYGVQTDEGSGESDIFTNDAPERPETPSPAERPFRRARPASPANRGVGQRAAVGRPSGAVVDILHDAFQKIDDKFHEVSGQVGMPFHQVVARYTKQFSRMNTANFWNMYQKYATANKDTELARVPEADVNATPSSRLARCYQLFRDEYPDTWHEILTAFEEVDAMEGHTVSHRALVFEKLAKNFKLSFSAMAKVHAFEGVFVMAGSVVNQDAGLGFAFATPGAEDFFPDRCRADQNEILGHFKAHIYNKASLSHVDLAFEDAQEEASTTKKDVEEIKDDEQDEQEDHSRVRKAFVSALLKSGCKWATGKLFPWKNLPAKLAKSGVICYNYPDSVPFPGEERQSRSKGGSKGISNLTLAECSTLIGALGDTSKFGLHFKLALPDTKSSLQQSRIPVIYGAAPEPGSERSRAKRMYANLTVDYKGAARKKDHGITRIKKKKEKAQDTEDVISIGDSEDSAVRTTSTKTKNHHPSAGGVVDLTESPDQDGCRRGMGVVTTRPVRKAAKRKLEIDQEEREDLSSPSGSDYQPDAVDLLLDVESDGDEGSVAVEEHDIPSRKRQRTTEASARPSKRTLISKGKRKASNVDPPPAKRVRVMSAKRRFDSSDESDSNGGPSMEKALQVRPVTQSTVITLASIPGPSRDKASQVMGATQSAVIAPGSIATVVPLQDQEAVEATISGPSIGAASVDVTPPPRSVPAASVIQEYMPLDVANDPLPQETIRSTVQSAPSMADPLPLTTAPLGRARPKPRLVSKSNPSRNNIDEGEDPFNMRKKRRVSTAAPLDIADAGVSQLQAAEEGRAGVPATVVTPTPGATGIPGSATVVAPAPIATSASFAGPPPVVAPVPPSTPVVTIAPIETVAPVTDITSVVSERIVFPRLPLPFKNDACAPPQEGRESMRASASEGVPPGFNDQVPIMGGGWYPPPLHAYHGGYPPFLGPYTQWPSYAELDRARARNPMAPPTHAMGGYPANMPSFDANSFYYRGQPPFVGAHPNHASFIDARAHAGMSHSSSGTNALAVSAPSCDASEEGTETRQ